MHTVYTVCKEMQQQHHRPMDLQSHAQLTWVITEVLKVVLKAVLSEKTISANITGEQLKEEFVHKAEVRQHTDCYLLLNSDLHWPTHLQNIKSTLRFVHTLTLQRQPQTDHMKQSE